MKGRLYVKLIKCAKCGGSDFVEQEGYSVCLYCRSKYDIYTDAKHSQNSYIAIDDDIEILLKKCRASPANAKKYANLILDIDPNNAEAKMYL